MSRPNRRSVTQKVGGTITPMARDPIDRLRGEMEELFAELWQARASAAGAAAIARPWTSTGRSAPAS